MLFATLHNLVGKYLLKKPGEINVSQLSKLLKDIVELINWRSLDTLGY